MNCFPHGGDFLPNGYTSEELKLVNETRKIFNDETIQVSATVVRIPVIGGHSEAVNVETHKPFNIEEIKDDNDKVLYTLISLEKPEYKNN